MSETVTDRIYFALARIAKGNPNGGRPLASETARQIAREALVETGLGWSHTSIKSIPHEGYVK